VQIIDARSLGAQLTEVSCDVCVVGSGAAGTYLGVRLAERGLSVVILEAGGRTGVDGARIGIEAEFGRTQYRGATDGRAFGLGGSTSRWGGLLIPHSERDLRRGTDRHLEAWRHIVGTVARNSERVYETLGLRPPRPRGAEIRHLSGRAADALSRAGLELAAAEFLPFRRKNLACLLDRVPDGRGNLRVFLHAVAVHWELFEGGAGKPRVKSVRARCGDCMLSTVAASFVVAAGAVESARILLEMERQVGWRPFRQGAAVGHYLGDHLSCAIAEVPRSERKVAIHHFGPRFAGGTMRSFRIMESCPPEGAPRAFAHFIFQNESAGFQLAKKLLGGLQSRSVPQLSPRELANGATGIVALGWNRVVRSRLHVPYEAKISVQLDIEQQPNYRNRIRLDDQTDSLGRPVPVIEWEITERDHETIQATADRILARWAGSQAGLPELIPLDGDAAGLKPHDAYHPVGVCRLGTDQESVVDPGLHVHGMANLAVLSTAVFPSAGTANPTFSMLCLGEDLAIRLHRVISK
jgi:choline dehydrogenase-like flavoprotein